MQDVGEEDSDWENGTTKPEKKNSSAADKKDRDEEESDYSDWEGLADKDQQSDGQEEQDNSPAGILKRKQYFEAQDDEEEDVTVDIESMEVANDQFTYPGKSVVVLKQSLEKATFAASQAALYGFPEPSIYRDEDEVTKEGDNGSKGRSTAASKQKLKPKQKKKKFRYLTKTERKANVHKERGRSREKRTRGKGDKDV